MPNMSLLIIQHTYGPGGTLKYKNENQDFFPGLYEGEPQKFSTGNEMSIEFTQNCFI